ncbi:hypothetical protein LPB72_03490 [Hydrogenophaga crassostreae]|uniref:N-acetyltransferase domain-containing protein n=1 Tax=Hydrogenophaga crassostreae TaxID=1763535 RepID=A0A167IUH9_9BURK|nr:GNAT family N-acetyltransferase [Hydrogenophaga crassostreae]AOW14372.1 hypothetical protein LPB072_17545 [Hydrogenophaga crassostreae]OAD43604.1 hypothetical protein LPB72_03490 [Hydrogenophaga crassostreae]
MVVDWADANVKNLFQLWQAMGADSRVRPDGSELFRSRGWPHRCWVMGATALPVSAAELPLNPDTLYPQLPETIHGHAMAPVIDALGMSEVFAQTAMVWRRNCWPVNALVQSERPLTLITPKGEDQVNTWVEVAALAFGYGIDNSIFHNLARHASAQLVLACAGERAVATALLFRTGKELGLHQFGVLPEAQGNGYASQLLQALLQPAFLRDCEAVTLQASVAGFPLYQKQGFESQFGIRNFRRGLPSDQGLSVAHKL